MQNQPAALEHQQADGGADQLGPVLREALQQSVPVLIDIPIDYSQNLKLMQDVHQDFIH